MIETDYPSFYTGPWYNFCLQVLTLPCWYWIGYPSGLSNSRLCHNAVIYCDKVWWMEWIMPCYLISLESQHQFSRLSWPWGPYSSHWPLWKFNLIKKKKNYFWRSFYDENQRIFRWNCISVYFCICRWWYIKVGWGYGDPFKNTYELLKLRA